MIPFWPNLSKCEGRTAYSPLTGSTVARQCVTCLRKVDPGHGAAKPPALVGPQCPNYIDAEDMETV